MKRLRPLPLIAAGVAVIAVIAGSLLRPGARERVEAWTAKAIPGPRLAMVQAAAPAAVAERSGAAPGDALDQMAAARMLIRTASLALEVKRYAEAVARAEALAATHGGYVADAAVARDPGDRQSGTLTLRIRADRFDEALRALEALGKVERASVDTRDVGREYMELETRLSAKRDAEARVRQLLRTQTGRLADVIEAEKELSRLIEEREVLEGQRRFYDRQVALSTITVELHEPVAVWRESALAPLSEALRQALPLLAGSVAALVYAIAAALPWALLGLLAWRLGRRLRVRRLERV